MRAGLALVLVGGCTFTVPAPAGERDASPIDGEPGPWLAGFAYRKPITLAPPGTGSLAAFPVALQLATDPELAAHAAGPDLVVTTGDGLTRLATELVTFGAGGELELWIAVPQLALGVPTALYLYYGGAAAPTDPTAVWPRAMFRGVWHLGDAATGARDSTPAGNHLDQVVAPMVPAHVASVGDRGRARTFDGADDRLEIADPADGSLDVGLQSFTVSLWVRATGSVSAFDTPIYKGGTTGSLPGYCMFLGSGAWAGKLHDGSGFIEPTFSPAPLVGQWLHVAMVIDREGAEDVARAYRDGVLQQTFTFDLGSFDSATPLWLGAGSNGAQFRGALDEVRIYAGARTAAWLATEHANLRAPGFATVGAEQAR